MRCHLISRQELSGIKSGKKELKDVEGPSISCHISWTSDEKPMA